MMNCVDGVSAIGAVVPLELTCRGVKFDALRGEAVAAAASSKPVKPNTINILQTKLRGLAKRHLSWLGAIASYNATYMVKSMVFSPCPREAVRTMRRFVVY